MDTTETNIKMCDCSEIQDGWNGTVGDWIAHRGKGIILFQQPHDLLRGYSGAIWLPRQDQLQEMLMPLPVRMGHRVPQDLLRYFNNWVQSHDWKWQHYLATMEQLWLAFVMKDKHGKVWDGTEWLIYTR